ncbi:MAG: prepilin-type N-terminal cleavage/methylation domain-containing protein [Gemmatimonadota bacterium]|nr:prepilin-type N-terminal cleavage/methylation domain-containing protein [Gemmatimonadota bacterium]
MGDTAENAGRRHARGGFSMVEVIIAMIILTVGVLGLAGTTAFIVRQVTLSDLMTERAAAFQTVVDRLQSLPYDSVAAGADSIGIFEATWTAVADGGQNKIVTIVTTGPGMTSVAGGAPFNAPQVVDTFTFRILRR